jgi:DNA polymerase II small subunit/DNA polymerase delta subunit B
VGFATIGARVRGKFILSLASFVFIFQGATFASNAMAESWGRHEVNLKGYQIKIRNSEDELRELIAKKNSNRNPKVRDEILKEIIQKSEDLKKTFADMKSEEEHIRFQHPEKGDETERKYRHLRLKSVKDLENEVGVDGQLSRLKAKVKDKYEN